MTNPEIVECIYRDFNDEITNYISTQFRWQYVDDVKQEVYTKLLTLNNKSLFNVYFTIGVMFYIKRIILNIKKHKYSVYNKMRLRYDYETTETSEQKEELTYEDQLKEHRLNVITDVLESHDFFAQLYKYKIKNNVPLYTIEKDLLISKRSLRYQFELVRKKIKSKIMTKNEQDFINYYFTYVVGKKPTAQQINEAHFILRNERVGDTCNQCVKMRKQSLDNTYISLIKVCRPEIIQEGNPITYEVKKDRIEYELPSEKEEKKVIPFKERKLRKVKKGEKVDDKKRIKISEEEAKELKKMIEEL